MTKLSPRLISRADLAQMLGITPRTLENWEKDGYGPKPIRLRGRSIRYSMADVDSFLSAAVQMQAAS